MARLRRCVGLPYAEGDLIASDFGNLAHEGLPLIHMKSGLSTIGKCVLSVQGQNVKSKRVYLEASKALPKIIAFSLES